MLTVMIVLGIMLGIAVTRIAPSVRSARVRNAASILAGDLQYAQLQAVRHRRPIAIGLNTSTMQLVIRDRDNPPGNIWRTRSLGMETDFDLDSMSVSPSNWVEVFPNGIVRQTTAWNLAVGTHTRTVTLTRAGQISIN